jgi:hypothetical protein
METPVSTYKPTVENIAHGLEQVGITPGILFQVCGVSKKGGGVDFPWYGPAMPTS